MLTGPKQNCKWSSWSSYSSCSKSCGSGGTQSRTRSKTQVEKYGGSCSGSTSHSKSCLVKHCPGRYSSISNYIYWQVNIYMYVIYQEIIFKYVIFSILSELQMVELVRLFIMFSILWLWYAQKNQIQNSRGKIWWILLGINKSFQILFFERLPRQIFIHFKPYIYWQAKIYM